MVSPGSRHRCSHRQQLAAPVPVTKLPISTSSAKEALVHRRPWPRALHPGGQHGAGRRGQHVRPAGARVLSECWFRTRWGGQNTPSPPRSLSTLVGAATGVQRAAAAGKPLGQGVVSLQVHLHQ